MHVFGGLKRQDWERWGQFTTFKGECSGFVGTVLAAGSADLLLALG
jgi:hypothetical protein